MVTVTVEEVVVSLPLGVIDAGLNVHAAPTGSPEHARAIAVVNPVEAEMETVAEPVAPGAVITTVGSVFPGVVTKNPGVIEKLGAAALLLALKLASPG